MSQREREINQDGKKIMYVVIFRIKTEFSKNCFAQ